MITKIIVNEEEIIQLNNSKEFKLGEEFKCYGVPFIVTSITRRKKNSRAVEEILVNAIEKEMYYNTINLSVDNVIKHKLYATSDKPYKSITTPYDNPFGSIK